MKITIKAEFDPPINEDTDEPATMNLQGIVNWWRETLAMQGATVHSVEFNEDT